MRWHWLSILAAGMLAAAVTVPLGARDVPPTSPEGGGWRLEVARLRAHFDSVNVELRYANEPSLTPSQRRARDTLISWLQEYRNAGNFPLNDRFTELAMPFFRDSRGVLCAMAYLIDRSGRRDLVDRIAATRNNAFIAELADDSELRVWLDSVGLSVVEAGRIQPSYEPPPVATQVTHYDTAWNRRDTSEVGQLLAPGYQYFTSRGKVSSRAERIALLSSPDYRLDDAKRSEISVSLGGPVAVVSSRWVGRGTYRGLPFRDDQRCGQTWLLTDDETWRLLSEHCVRITPTTPAPPN
jgi:uncharacterized protein DUF4440